MLKNVPCKLCLLWCKRQRVEYASCYLVPLRMHIALDAQLLWYVIPFCVTTFQLLVCGSPNLLGHQMCLRQAIEMQVVLIQEWVLAGF